MSYENAPATKMLATECCICCRPLVDAKSVEIGIGPTCREKYGYSELDGLSEDARIEANKLIYLCAANARTFNTGYEAGKPDVVVDSIRRLVELGAVRVATAILDRVADVKIAFDATAKRYAVKSTYSEIATNAFRAVNGRRWDKEKKLNTFPMEAKADLFNALSNAYPFSIGVGPKGVFRLGVKAATVAQPDATMAKVAA